MKACQGLTLLELMIVLVIAGLLLGLGAPAFQNLVAEEKRTASTNRLMGSLQYAKSESLRLNHPVSLCPSRDGQHCDNDQQAWDQGWLVYRHNSRHGDSALIDPGQILSVVDQAPPGLRANRQRFTLRTDGRRSTNGTFLFCPPGVEIAEQAVVVSVMGRPRHTRDPDRIPSPQCR